MNIHLVFDYQNCHRYCVKRAKCQIIPRLQMSEQTSKQVSNWILTSSNFVIPFQNCSYVNPFSSQINEISSINKYTVQDGCSVIKINAPHCFTKQKGAWTTAQTFQNKWRDSIFYLFFKQSCTLCFVNAVIVNVWLLPFTDGAGDRMGSLVNPHSL